MKTSANALPAIAAAVLLLAAAPVSAENIIGLFFDDYQFDEQTARVDTSPGQPFNGYVVLLEAGPSTIAAYELGITLSSSAVTVMAVSGPNGWINFGGDLNHIAGYVTPLPTDTGGTVLCTFNLVQMDESRVDIEFGPSSPSSLADGLPVLADGADMENLLPCELFGGGPRVAALNVPPPEIRDVPLSRVKALFD